MKKHKIHLAVALFFLLLSTFHLEATVYTYNTTIDIRSPWYISHPAGQWNYMWTISGTPTFTLQAGDTVQGTVSFASNEALQFLGPVSTASIVFSLRDWTNTIPNSTHCTTSLQGVTGSLTWPNPTVASSSGPGYSLDVGFAQISTPTAVSFTGFSYSATVLSGSGHYTPYFFTANTPYDVEGAISVVPEPYLAGLIGIGLIILSQKHRTVANRLGASYGERILS